MNQPEQWSSSPEPNTWGYSEQFLAFTSRTIHGFILINAAFPFDIRMLNPWLHHVCFQFFYNCKKEPVSLLIVSACNYYQFLVLPTLFSISFMYWPYNVIISSMFFSSIVLLSVNHDLQYFMLLVVNKLHHGSSV